MAQKKNKNQLDTLWVWLGLLLSLSVMFWSTWLALQHRLFPGELELLAHIYDFSDDLSDALLVITNLGTAALLIGVVIWLELKQRTTLLLRTILGAGITSIIILFLKNIIDRGRPDALLNLQSHELYTLTSQGFPSGHTAFSTVIVVTLLPFVPKRYWPLLLIIPLFVGFSRLGLGVHLPLDVVAGLAIGTLVAVGVRLSTTTEVFIRQHKRLASRIKKE